MPTIRRLLVATVVSLGMAVSGTAMAAQAAGATPAASAVSGVQTPGVATLSTQTAPTFDCVPGIVSTICGLVAPIICRTHCEAAPATGVAAAPRASTGRTSGAAAAPSLRGGGHVLVARGVPAVQLPVHGEHPTDQPLLPAALTG